VIVRHAHSFALVSFLWIASLAAQAAPVTHFDEPGFYPGRDYVNGTGIGIRYAANHGHADLWRKSRESRRLDDRSEQARMKSQLEYVDRCKQLQAEGKAGDEILAVLRSQGCSKVQSIAVVAECLGMSLVQAKKWVHSSPAWADVKERDDRLQMKLGDAKD
jgi:ribosomal protein L7/L12